MDVRIRRKVSGDYVEFHVELRPGILSRDEDMENIEFAQAVSEGEPALGILRSGDCLDLAIYRRLARPMQSQPPAVVPPVVLEGRE